MKRLPSTPRPDFEKKVSDVGLVFYDTPQDDGTVVKYWPEDAYYEFTSDEVDYLEGITDELHHMCVSVVPDLCSGKFGDLGLPKGALDLVRFDFERGSQSVYGRFDLCWDGTSDAKMFEYNADTPTGLVESAIAQWYWLQDLHPDRDQWNSLHERLVTAWQGFARTHPKAPVHFAYFKGEDSGEEWMTVAYMRDAAGQAGLDTVGITVEEIGWDEAGYFTDLADNRIQACFKLYPWENMLREEYGEHILQSRAKCVWIEPAWKTVLSNKALLAALWAKYPNHPNLLPAYMAEGQLPPKELAGQYWIAKPLHGREGDSMRWNTPDGPGQAEAQNWGNEGYCYQQWCPLPDFDGYRPVLGTWVVEGRPAGLGIRESKAYVTDNFARFIPHVIDAPAPSAEEVSELLARTDFSD